MAGNIATPQYEIESTPNLTKIQSMTTPVVMVFQVLPKGGNKFEMKLLINMRMGMSPAEILALHDTLPDEYGPGVYRFEVTDQDSTDKAVWQLRLGKNGVGAEQLVQQARAGATAPQVAPTSVVQQRPSPPAPIAPDAVDIGGGIRYTASLSLLSTPDGRVFPWRKGDPIPVELSGGTAPSAMPAPVTPLGSLMTPTGPTATELQLQRELELTRKALNDIQIAERERAAEQRHAQEIAQLQSRFEQGLSESNKRLEMVLGRLTEMTAPKGPSPEALALAEMQRQNAERDRLEGLRSEMASKIDVLANLVRDAAARPSGTDPMMTLLGQFITQMQSAQASTVQAIRDTTTAQLATAQNNQMTPDRLVALMGTLREASQGPLNEKMMGAVGDLFDQVIKLRRAEAELSGDQGGGGWVDVIRDLAGRAGGAVQTVAAYKMREAQAATAQAQAQTAQAQAKVAQARVVAARQQQQQQQPQQIAATHAAEVSAPSPKVEELRGQKAVTQMENATLKDLRAVFGKESDDRFFGPATPHVEGLREEIAATPGKYSPAEIARMLLMAREQLAALPEPPRVIELLAFDKVEYVIERLLPEANEGFRNGVVDALRVAMAEVDGTPADADDDEDSAEVEGAETGEESDETEAAE
jgi:hypothetical protein